MKVVLAESLGMCFGVRDAISMALDAPFRSDLTVLGELVHNADVLRQLDSAGIRTASSPDEPVTTGHVMITAHGAAHSVVDDLRARGLEVLEATCPLVRHAHRMLERLVAAGYFPVVIGDPGHVEVRGLVGDLAEYAVIRGSRDLPLLAGRPKLGVVSQTTQPLDHVLQLVDEIRAVYPDSEVRWADTVCQPTKERQIAARRLASASEVVVVVGGRNSNNTRQLVRACEAEGARAYQVEGPQDLRPEWFTGVGQVGLTAGTSTPDAVIVSVRRALEELPVSERPVQPDRDRDQCHAA